MEYIALAVALIYIIGELQWVINCCYIYYSYLNCMAWGFNINLTSKVQLTGMHIVARGLHLYMIVL